MKVIYDIGKIKILAKGAVLVIGVFDGVHRGHQKLIQKAVARAKQLKTKACVMTFWPHPAHVLYSEVPLSLLTSLAYRLKLIEQLGVARCIVIRFTKGFSRVTPEQFIKKYLCAKIQPKEIFVGDDFRFGHGREGTLKIFKEAGKGYGFKVNVVDSLGVSAKGTKRKIGSSLIRQHISQGKLDKAAQLLGRPVSVMGKVTKGDGRGKTLGFPTLNIYPENEVIPPLGVYAVRVHVGKKIIDGMANVGRRPSFKTHDIRVNIEAHLFHFRQNCYGKEVIIEFLQKIREEQTFRSKAALTAQLEKDERAAKTILAR